MRSIGPARETFAAAAFVGLLGATILRLMNGLPGAAAGLILTVIALALLSRYRVSWDKDGISDQTPFRSVQKSWAELSGFSLEPLPDDNSSGDPADRRRSSLILQGTRLRLHGSDAGITIGLMPYSWQDIRHLTDAIGHELPAGENAAALVS